MKSHRLFILIFALLLAAGAYQTPAQGNKTIVLVRHAEKDGTVANAPDPDLSPDGRLRTERLTKVIKRHKPHEIFSTNFKRTRQTAEPIAKRRGREIQTYDASKPAELIDKIMASKTDHYLIVGHSNTIPALANALAKKEVFKNLLDTEYGVYWVIKMKNGVMTRIEVFPY